MKPGLIKGWNRHKLMTLNLIVPFGRVLFVIVKKRDGLLNSKNTFEVELSPKNYKCLTIPPGLWIGFKGLSKNESIVLSIASLEHDPDEKESIAIKEIPYSWGKH